MGTEVSARFDSPGAVAAYLGDTVGTHYSAALRAAEAYGKHLAPQRKLLQEEKFRGDSLEKFWKEMMRSEQVKVSSSRIVKELGSDPSFYFAHFLDTAESVFIKRYQEVSPAQKKKIGQTQHRLCLQVMRDQEAAGMEDHFTVRNRVAAWIQLVKALGQYRE